MSFIIVIWLVAIDNRHNGFVVCRCLFIIHDAGIFIVGSFRLKHRACAIFSLRFNRGVSVDELLTQISQLSGILSVQEL